MVIFDLIYKQEASVSDILFGLLITFWYWLFGPPDLEDIHLVREVWTKLLNTSYTILPVSICDMSEPYPYRSSGSHLLYIQDWNLE